MKRFSPSLAALLALFPQAPALAQTRALPPGEIRADGDITFGNALKLGKRDGNRTVITPDTLQILGKGSTGDGSGFSATPSDGRAADLLADLIGRTSERFLPENYGVSASGTADAYAAINAAIQVANPVKGEVVLRRRTYSIAQTIKVPTDVTLRFEGATLKPLSNITTLRVSHRGKVDGWGWVEVGGVSSYSQAAVEFDGADFITSGQISGNIRLWNSSGQHTGVGLRLHSPNGGRVIYTRTDLNEIRGFSRGVQVLATGSGFSNSNFINVGSIYDCNEGIVTEVDNPQVAGSGYNFFSGNIQPALTATRALRLGGQGNQVHMMIWDWYLSASPNTAITFSAGSKNNRVSSSIGQDMVEDLSSAFKVDANVVEDWSSASPSNRAVLPPSLRFQTFAGNQDDILAFADKHAGWTVTQTAGSAPTAGSLASIFDLNAGNSVQWNTASTFPVTIEVDFGSTPPGYLQGLGAAFNFGGVASNVSLETYDGTTWTPQRAYSNNGKARLSWLSANFVTNVQKVRLTLSGPPSTGTIFLERFFGFGTIADGGYAFRPRITNDPLMLRESAGAPATVTGYGQMFMDKDGKTKIKRGSGTVETFATSVPTGATTAYTPTVTCGNAGAITTLGTTTGRYQQINEKLVFVEVDITITTNGGCAGSLDFTLPFTAAARPFVLPGRLFGAGSMIQGFINPSATKAQIVRYDNLYTGGDNTRNVVSGVYEIQ